MPRLSRRSFMAGSVPLLGAGAAALSSSASAQHVAPPRRARRPRRGARRLPRRSRGQPPRQRLRPARDPARLRLGHDDAHAQRPGAAPVDAGGVRPRDRGDAGRPLRGLDLQRPHPGPDAALPRGRAPADHLLQRLGAPAHDPLPRHPPGGDGRRARHRRRPDPARRHDRLRVRRAAGRPAPLPLPRAPAGRAHRQGPLRRVHRRPEGRARGRRRDGDGDERVRHELRSRQRGLRGEHDRLRVHGQADRGQARRARAHLPRQRPRVRPDQLVPPAREPVRLLPDGHAPGVCGLHGHGDAVPGAARACWSGASPIPDASCSTPISRSSRSWDGRGSSRSCDQRAARLAARAAAARADRRGA